MDYTILPDGLTGVIFASRQGVKSSFIAQSATFKPFLTKHCTVKLARSRSYFNLHDLDDLILRF